MPRELEENQKQKSQKLSSFNELREVVKPNFFAHVDLAKNINNDVVNSLQKPINKGIVGFFFLEKVVIFLQKYPLHTFCIRI